MKKLLNFFPLLALILFIQCKAFKALTTGSGGSQLKATVTKEGLITCFEKGLSANGVAIWCEASAILYDGKKLFIANDKDMPDKRSSVFYWAFKNGFADTTQSVVYLNNPILKNGKKFEDFALTPDGNIVFLNTGFDRIKPGTTEWNGYNTIYYWQIGNEKNLHVLSPKNTDSTSVFLRDKISNVLKSSEFPQGMPYFKIEGLAATKDKLYFGVREEGKKFDDFKYKTKILTITYRMKYGKIELGDNFKVLSDFNITSLQPSLKQPMGISSIEYDHFNKRFLILTSFETGEKRGGYLWTATQRDLENNRMNLVRDAQANPVFFTNKAEDIAIINKNKIIIIHDDDRGMPTVAGRLRQPNQAAYSIVEFK